MRSVAWETTYIRKLLPGVTVPGHGTTPSFLHKWFLIVKYRVLVSEKRQVCLTPNHTRHILNNNY
jgi:hypothetical protein